MVRLRRLRRALSAPALRRPAAARRARPRAGDRAGRAAARRAVRRARQEAAREHADRDAPAAAAARHHDPDGDARPGRGADAVGSHRRDARGRIEQFGTPTEIYERPVSRFVASFIGTSNFFSGQVTGRHERRLHGRKPRRREARPQRRAAGRAGRHRGAAAGRHPAVARRTTTTPAEPPCARRSSRSSIAGCNTHYLLRRPDGEPLIVIRQNDKGADAVAGLEPGAQRAGELGGGAQPRCAGRRMTSDRTPAGIASRPRRSARSRRRAMSWSSA